MSEEKKQQLAKSMNTFEGMMFVVGVVIGSGVFLKPAIVLRNMGSTGAALAMWIFGGIITIAATLTIAEIAGYITKVGGLYTYLSELYNEVVGFLFGWVGTFINIPGSAAALAIACATFSTFFVPMTGFQQKAFAVSLVVILVIAQVISTRYGVWLQVISTIGKLAPIAIIAIYGLAHGSAHMSFAAVGHMKSAAPGVALLGVLWAYDGWLSVCTLAPDMKRPERDIPKAVIYGIAFVMVVYVAFNAAIFAALPGDVVANSKKIGVDVCIALFGKNGAMFITIGMMLSVFGALNGMVTCGSRYTFAMAERRHLPAAKSLSYIHPKLGTPIPALLFQGVIAILYILTGTFDSITNMIIFALWIFYTMGVAAIFVLRKKVKHNSELYHVPLYPLVPVIGILGGVYLMVATLKDSPSSAIVGLGLTLIGLPVYYYCKHKNKDNEAEPLGM
jgi:APA family basic amino acid/polyamine antiporter